MMREVIRQQERHREGGVEPALADDAVADSDPDIARSGNGGTP
jgi:hypothetical protein